MGNVVSCGLGILFTGAISGLSAITIYFLILNVDEIRSKRKMLYAACLAGIVWLVMIGIYKSQCNVFYIAERLIVGHGTYQDIELLATMLIGNLVVTYVVAIVVRTLCLGRRTLSFQRKQRQVLCTNFLVYMFLIGGCYYLRMCGLTHIQINEVCGNNQTIVIDGNGQIADYIELYNAGKLSYELDDIYLSDDKADLNKFCLSGYEISAEDFLVIPMEQVIGFAIDKHGESIYLSDGQGNILDEITFGELDTNYSYARINEGSEEWAVKICSPQMANAKMADWLETPTFSKEGGFYEEAFYLELYAQDAVTIYYTLDGSKPSKDATIYKEPIYVYDKSAEKNVARAVKNVRENWRDDDDEEPSVDKAFIVRAIGIDEEGNSSEIVNATYFIQKEQYENKNVISLIADPNDLFGDNGIYVTGSEYEQWLDNNKEGDWVRPNFYKSGIEWERNASMEYFSNGGRQQQDVGIRIMGNGTRSEILKPFSIFSRDEYSGSGVFEIDLFEGKQIHSVMLKKSFINVFVNELIVDRAVGYQQSKEVTLFLNGEYWYDTYMLEKYAARYFEETYGVDKDNVIVVKNQKLNTGYESDINYFNLIQMYLDTHTFEDEKDYEEFCNMVDIDSYIDWYCANVYLCNIDLNENKNCFLWRVREPGDGEYNDGKWRWLMYDMDAVAWEQQKEFGVEDAAAIDAFSVQPLYCEAPLNQQPMYKKLKTIPKFREQFVLTFMDLVNENFLEENIAKKLEEWGENITWKNSFFAKRAQYAVPYLAREFALQGTLENVVLSTREADGGYIQLNSIAPDLSKGSWIGMYFTDYPVTVTAVANPGYKFVGWTGTVESDEQTMTIQIEEGGLWLDAVFEKVE